jgi:hypothetical protein
VINSAFLLLYTALIRRSGENMRFRQTIFIGLVFAQLFSMKNMLFNSQKRDLYDYEKTAFIHRVINAQWHDKVGLRFFRHL